MPQKEYSDPSGLAYYWLENNMGRILFIAFFAAVGLWGLLLEGRAALNPLQQVARGIGPELAGIVIAAVTIDALAERRQQAERKKILISQLGSQSRDVTELAIIELRNREWLFDGSLNEAYLRYADLSRADLRGASLSKANLGATNLSGAKLGEANLSGAYVPFANLSQVDLGGANLTEASLWGANLSGADLGGANLSRAYLKGANLSIAWLLGADLSEANLEAANLDRVNLRFANLSRAYNWTIEQLEQAETLEESIMPDQVQLQTITPEGETKMGPTFEEWKEQYLAKHGGTAKNFRSE